MNHRPSLLLLLGGSLGLLLGFPVWADDWPGFRGGSNSASAEADGLFEGEGPGLAVQWKASTGSAYSSLAVADGRVITMSNDGQTDTVVAFDSRSGSRLWSTELDTFTKGHDGSEDGPSSTPAISRDLEHVYVFAANGVLRALRLSDGHVTWAVNVHALEGIDDGVTADHVASIEGGPGIPFYGHASSPLLFEDLVIVSRGTSETATLAAFDAATGALAWTALPGSTAYQSPVRAVVHDTPTILFWTNDSLAGLTADGEVAWTCEAPANNNSSAIDAAENRVLLVGDRSSTLLRLERSSAGEISCAEIWTTRRLKGSMSSHVVTADTIFGFDRQFLSALDLDSGEVLWKSRPPGGSGLLLVGDRLAIFAKDGQVVLAKASRDGYREEARLAVTQRDSLTWPAFADGALYVRDRTHVAAVRITDEPMQLATPEPALVPGTEFARFIEGARASNRAALYVDQFFRSQDDFPVREGDDLVHFVYRGEVDDVGLLGTWLPGGVELTMERLPGTDFFYRSVRVPPGLRVEYALRFDFDQIEVDPLNPLTVPGTSGGRRSLLLPPAAEQPAWLAPYEGSQPGRAVTFTLQSESRGDEREITVYLPHELASRDRESLHLAVLPNGPSWQRNAQLQNTLDHLIEAGELPPTVLAFVPRDQRRWFLEDDGALTPPMIELLADELMVELEQRYDVVVPAERTAILAYDWTNGLALSALVHRPDRFGNAAIFSHPYGLQLEPQIVEDAQALDSGTVRLYLDRNEFAGGEREGSVWLASRTLMQSLQGSGIHVLGEEHHDSEGWGSRRIRVVEALRTLFEE